MTLRLPTWTLAAAVLGCCGWGYVRLGLLEPRLGDLLREAPGHAGEIYVLGHSRVLSVDQESFRIRVAGVPVVVTGQLSPEEVGGIVSIRARIRADGSLDALEIQTHRGRPKKVAISAIAALLLLGYLAWRVRWDRDLGRFRIRSPDA